MKAVLLAGMSFAILHIPDSVSFEPESVRVGSEEVSDLVLQLKETAAGHILVSKGCIEPLVKPLQVVLSSDRVITIEPGVRITRAQDGFSLSLHNRRRIELSWGDEKLTLVVPVTLAVTEKGWKIAGQDLGPVALAVRRSPQDDDVDKNLQQLKASARKIQDGLNGGNQGPSQPNGGGPVTNPRQSLFGGGGTGGAGSGSGLRYPIAPIFRDLTVGDAGFDAISPLTQASPFGFGAGSGSGSGSGQGSARRR